LTSKTQLTRHRPMAVPRRSPRDGRELLCLR
jgi:hypothetical protein